MGNAYYTEQPVNSDFPWQDAWRLCRAILRDANLADDATQEAYLRYAADNSRPWKSCAIFAARDVRRAHYGDSRRGSLRRATRPLAFYVNGSCDDSLSLVRHDVRSVTEFLPSGHDRLARRLRFVARDLANGYTQQETADRLRVSLRMVARLVATLREIVSKYHAE